MAKAAKQRDEVTERDVTKFVSNILARYENIATARGKFMLAARREREAMTAIYESMAQKGVSQKASKTEIKIVRAIESIKGWIADLEIEDRKQVQKFAKMQKDKQQLSLFADLPKPTKAEIKEAKQEAARVSGGDLSEAAPAGSA
jgi:hypothetical protein